MIDVDEMIGTFRESESRELRDAAAALESLRAWVNELQMNVKEREAIAGLAAYCDTRATPEFQKWGSTLRVFLARCGR